MLKQLHYNLDLNLFSFLNHGNISILSFVKKENKFVLYLKINSACSSQFIIKKIILEDFWFNFFFKYLVIKNHTLFIINPKSLRKKSIFKLFFSFLALLKRHLISLNYGWTAQLNLIGLGYKSFFYRNFLYFRLGYCRMVSVKIPAGIKFLSKRKDSIKFLSNDKILLGNFIAYLKTLRKFNLYKGKGLYELKDFSTIKLKVGKQQQMF